MSTLTTVLVSVISSVSLSALTATLVTLVIPPSEARKERILEQYRAKREIARQLRIIVLTAGLLSTEIPPGTSERNRDQINEFLSERRQAIIDAVQKIDDAIVDASLRADESQVLSGVRGLTHGIALSDRSMREASESLRGIAGECLNFYVMPSWSFRRRRAFHRLAHELFADTSSANPTVSNI